MQLFETMLSACSFSSLQRPHQPSELTTPSDGCNAINTVNIMEEMADLSTIEVSGCKGLLSLQVASRGLTEVHAKACVRLQEVVLASRSLQTVDVSHCSQLRSLRLPALQEQQQQPPQGLLLEGEMGGDAVPLAAPASALMPLVALPKLSTLYSEGGLPPDTVIQIRWIKAARRAAAAAATAPTAAGAN